ncbi:MAG: hypothetical protein LUH01_04600 [Parabacteroides gordonii]|nr:hypothetical protein [Parabacteroides gordonii]
MKFQNLIYATMVACAFSACSNDDDSNIPDPALELDATLTVAFNTVGNNGSSVKSLTKSSTNGEVGTIGIAVFNNGAMGNMGVGDLINYKERSANSDVDTTACIDAKEGSVNVLVVVNPPANVFDGKTDIDGFKDAISNAELSSTQPLMASAVIPYELKKGRNVASTNSTTVFPIADNQFSDNIKVFRNIANINLQSITLTPREDFTKDAKLLVSKVFIMHYRKAVKVFGNASEWCPVVDLTADIEPNTGGDGNKYAHAFSQEITGTTKADIAAENGGFFVYDNSFAIQKGDDKKGEVTALVIQGTYSYTTGNGETVTSPDAYWTVYINNNTTEESVGNADGYDTTHFGVLRNVKYAINATITGPGSDDPENPTGAASLTSNIEIVPWGQVNLDPDID